MASDLGLDLALVTIEGEAEARVLAKRAGSAGNHRRRTGVAAHGVDRDAWPSGHDAAGLRLVPGCDDLAAVIMAAGAAHIVRQLEFAAIRALLERGRLQRMVAAAHVPLRRRSFSFRDSHAAPSKAMSSIKIATISASSRRG